jgi:RNA polymerase sigma factor (sigma-70 family)
VKEFSDSEIIECLRKRQNHVVKYLSDRYLPMIRMMVFQNGGNADDANDIFQDALIIMLEKIDSNDLTLTCKFKTYLYCICENLWKRVLGKRQVAANYISSKNDDEAEKDISEEMDHQLHEQIFKDAFESMDVTSKAILNYYWQDMPPQEIADKLGLTYGYVRKRKCEAQTELTEKVKKHPAYRRIIETEKSIKDVVR